MDSLSGKAKGMAKDFYQPFYNDEFLMETSGVSMAAVGAYAKFKAKSWNASTRGELCRTIESYSQMFGCTTDQAKQVIEELTTGDTPVLIREDSEDGNIKLSHEPTRHRDRVSTARSAARKTIEKRDDSCFVPQKCHQKSNKPLDIDLDISPKGGAGGNDNPDGTIVIAEVDDDEIDDAEFSEWPLDRKVRHWLYRWRRFPLDSTPPKDVSTIVEAVRRWDWDFVKACLQKAFDNGAKRVVPYAMTIAEKEAAKRFADQPKPIVAGAKPSKTWRPG